MGKTTIAIERITPTQAKRMLEGNTQNRNLRPRVVAAYAADMKAGLWADQGDPIRMNGDGTLLDGQHRLHAIIESGKPQKMIVVRGVDKKSILTMDTGSKRTFADVLKLHGYSNVANLAAAIRACMLYEDGMDARTSRTVTNPQLMEYLTANDDLPAHVNAICKATSKSNIARRANVPLCMLRHLSGSPADVDAFTHQFVNGFGLSEGDPIHTLRRTLENQMLSSQTRIVPVVTHAITIKAWNAYARGEQVQMLRFKPGGAVPEKFPTIERA